METGAGPVVERVGVETEGEREEKMAGERMAAARARAAVRTEVAAAVAACFRAPAADTAVAVVMEGATRAAAARVRVAAATVRVVAERAKEEVAMAAEETVAEV